MSQLAETGRPMRRHTVGPMSSGLEEGLAGRDVLVTLRSSDSLWRAGCLHADFGRQLYGVSSDTLVRLASVLSEQRVKKRCCFVGRVALDLRLSRVCTGVAAMGQDCNYQLDITKLGRNRGKIPCFTVGMVTDILQTCCLAFSPKSSILVSSDQRILFLMVSWQTPSGLSCAFY